MLIFALFVEITKYNKNDLQNCIRNECVNLEIKDNNDSHMVVRFFYKRISNQVQNGATEEC